MAKKKSSSTPLKKDVNKLRGRNSTDHLFTTRGMEARTRLESAEDESSNPALRRLSAFRESRRGMRMETVPVGAGVPNWIPMGPLAVPNGQTYGGSRVLISGRTTALVPHPTDPQVLYLGTARGGIWKTIDGGINWTPVSDHTESLAIGALAISQSNPNVLYAGTGEGNLQYYSTEYPLSSAPGVYLGIGILKSTDAGASWVTHATNLLANHATYRIVVHPTNEQIAFAATSSGLCRTTDGVNWAIISGGGLPPITTAVIACTDLLIDANDSSGNTVYVAFWGSGIYRSTDALSVNPTWTQITSGLPAGSSTSRISLAQSHSMPQKIFALVANKNDAFDGVYQTIDSTALNWSKIVSSGITIYGAFTSNIAVDPTTPNILYVSGVNLYKCVNTGGSWNVTDIGLEIHPDSHCFAFHPTNSLIIYSGNDGGVYKSSDGGNTWDDTFNEGLCLMQFEAMEQHPFSDAFILGGTQDNGTQSYRNSPVYYHAADGDGGYCNISPVNPAEVVHSYYGITFERSTEGGKFETWSPVNSGIDGNGVFYPPSAISPSTNRMVVGTTKINIDDAQGTGGWPGTGVTLAGNTGKVTAVSFATDDIIYAGTSSGQVYRVELIGGIWTSRALHSSPLPAGIWIWDIGALPGNPSVVVAVFSSFGIKHVWQGTVPATGAATWIPISGSAGAEVPDIPVYALAFRSDTEFYVGTDIGIFRTTDSGASWSNYNQGMPNTAIYDLRFQSSTGLLRAATHGRGLWEIKIDTTPSSMSDLFFRDHLMHSGRFTSAASVSAVFEDPLDHVALGDPLYWWQCADIKVDSPNPTFQLTGAANYVDFETKLEHRNPERGNTNRVYVEAHNRGPLPADDVWVKIMFANASAGLPDLPADFWSTFPNSAGDANWTPVGAPQKITSLQPLKPEVLEWSWIPPATANPHTCMLVVMDCGSDPIPSANKVNDIATLVTNEKRAGLKNLHVVNLLPDEPGIVDFYLHGRLQDQVKLKIPKSIPKNVFVDLIVPPSLIRELGHQKLEGLSFTQIKQSDRGKILKHFKEIEFREAAFMKGIEDAFDLNTALRVSSDAKNVQTPFLVLTRGVMRLLIVITSGKTGKRSGRFSVIQTSQQDQIQGGSTFIFRPASKPQ